MKKFGVTQKNKWVFYDKKSQTGKLIFKMGFVFFAFEFRELLSVDQDSFIILPLGYYYTVFSVVLFGEGAKNDIMVHL